jgi:hypothetical protein
MASAVVPESLWLLFVMLRPLMVLRHTLLVSSHSGLFLRTFDLI